MRITGSVTLPHPVDAVWDALLDPAVLVRTIPGCSRLEVVGEHAYAMTVTAGVAAIKGTYDGSCVLTDLVPSESLTMTLRGAGAAGTIDAVVDVRFRALDDGGTEVSYDADATVGGMVGGVGQRMLSSVARRTAAEFFAHVGEAIAAPVPPRGPMPEVYVDAPPGAVPPAGPGVFYGSVDHGSDFVTGLAVGAGLVLLGVVAGRLLGRDAWRQG